MPQILNPPPDEPDKRKRVTVIASIQGVKCARSALTRLGFESISNFAKVQLMGKSTVDKFFNRLPIQLSSFKRICEGLRIDDWKSIAALERIVLRQSDTSELIMSEIELRQGQNLIEEAKQLEFEKLKFITDSTKLPTSQSETHRSAYRRITVIDKESREIKIEIVLEGDINSIKDTFSATLEALLKTYSGDTIRVTDIQSGSIRIKVQGSPEDIARLIDIFNSGELIEISGFPVKNIQILSQDFLEEETDSRGKWELVQEIVSKPAALSQLTLRDLSDADLSGVNLSGANLSGADFSNADLSGALLNDATFSRVFFLGVERASNGVDYIDANLSGANLEGSDLRYANLRHANLRHANLKRANLNYADLSDADLEGANFSFAHLDDATVENAYFGLGKGLTEAERRDLRRRGAIFDDSISDHSSINSPSPVR
jgi:hypothetical protein